MKAIPMCRSKKQKSKYGAFGKCKNFKLMSLSYCSDCKEKSVKTKCYTNKKSERKRVEFCLNKGCGYSKDLSLKKERG